MMEREEVRAMKLANRIMREIYGLDAGERKNYRSVGKVPSGSRILK